MISREVKRELYESSDTNCGLWFRDVLITCTGEEKIEVFEMMCLRNICGIRRADSEKRNNRRGVRV